MTDYLTAEDLMSLARELGVPHVRDAGLLESAAHRPSSSLFGQESYPSIHLKAAALLESLARNHSLLDGNKRLAWVAVVVFYRMNNLSVHAATDDAFAFVTDVCTGKIDYTASARALESWTAPSRPE